MYLLHKLIVYVSTSKTTLDATIDHTQRTYGGRRHAKRRQERSFEKLIRNRRTPESRKNRVTAWTIRFLHIDGCDERSQLVSTSVRRRKHEHIVGLAFAYDRGSVCFENGVAALLDEASRRPRSSYNDSRLVGALEARHSIGGVPFRGGGRRSAIIIRG